MNRKQTINKILEDLGELKLSGFDNQYAVDQNIRFFNAVRTWPSYIKWLYSEAGKIDPEKLLELSDLPLLEWDLALHRQLMEVSKQKIPGMVEPLVQTILSEVVDRGARSIIDLGCGGMEAVRQVIERVPKKIEGKLVFIGVDRSPVVWQLVQENFSDLSSTVDLVYFENLEREKLAEVFRSNPSKHLILVSRNDIFKLPEIFGEERADLVFHTRFKHHITKFDQKLLDQVQSKIAKTLVEFDEYKSVFLPIPQALATWKKPPLLNGAVLSRLRESSEQDIIKEHTKDRSLKFFRLLGAYVAIRDFMNV
jgi:hypothetical protein